MIMLRNLHRPMALLMTVLAAGCATSPDPAVLARAQAESERRAELSAAHARWQAAQNQARDYRYVPAPRGPVAAAELVQGFKPGSYDCDLKRTVEVTQVAPDGMSATLRWQSRDYPMRAVQAATGALRLENTDEGLVWISIVGKSMLLNARTGQQLANDCNRA